MIRREIFEEGSAKEIASVLLEPLLRRKPRPITAKRWLERLWGVEHREIRSFLVTSPFTMPGKLRVSATEVVQGRGQRRIKAGWTLWTRTDEKNFERVDVEVARKGGQETEWFVLDQIEWVRIKGNLEGLK